MKRESQKVLSIVTPCYNEGQNILHTYEVLKKALDAVGYSWEWVVADDHSQDDSPLILEELNKRDGRVGTVRLARNSGSHLAIRSGLREARGDCVIILSCDLQDSAALIPELLKKWEEGSQVVWAARQSRNGDSLVDRFLAHVFYLFVRNYIGMQSTPPAGSDYVLIDRLVIDHINLFKEHRLNLFALISWLGFSQSQVLYSRLPRLRGKSKWTFRAKLHLVSDTLAGFSNRPFRTVTAIGGAAILLGVGLVGSALVFSMDWRSTFALGGVGVLLMMNGVTWFFLGDVGSYLRRILRETQNRPTYVIEKRLSSVQNETIPLPFGAKKTK